MDLAVAHHLNRIDKSKRKFTYTCHHIYIRAVDTLMCVSFHFQLLAIYKDFLHFFSFERRKKKKNQSKPKKRKEKKLLSIKKIDRPFLLIHKHTNRNTDIGLYGAQSHNTHYRSIEIMYNAVYFFSSLKLFLLHK